MSTSSAPRPTPAPTTCEGCGRPDVTDLRDSLIRDPSTTTYWPFLICSDCRIIETTVDRDALNRSGLPGLRGAAHALTHQPCPVDGCTNWLDPIKVRNALSRHDDIYICSECGMAEAMANYRAHYQER